MPNFNKKSIFRMFSLVKPKMWRYTVGIVGISGTNAALTILLALVSKDMVNAAVQGDMHTLIHSACRVGIYILFLCIATPIFMYLFNSTVRILITDMGLRVFKHITGMNVNYFEDHHSGDMISCMTNDIRALEEALSARILALAITALAGIGSAVTMFFVSYKLTLIMLLFCILLSSTNLLYAKSIRILSNNIQAGMARLTERLTDIMAGYPVIRMFHIREKITGKFDAENEDIVRQSVKRSRNEAGMDSSSFLMSMLSFMGTICIAILAGIKQSSDLGTISMIVSLQSNVTALFLQIGTFVSLFQTSLAGADRVFALLDQPQEPERYAMPPEYSACEGIEMKNVSFSYGNGIKVLNDISFSIDKGQMAALAGSSGGGKSTVIKLLLGFYPVSGGSITIEGKPLSHYSLTEVRSMIAYVPQDAYLFDGTIYENICYGMADASKDEVIAAARAAYAHNFILQMPDGYDTPVGERGAKLSGGQRQRIAIARAMIKNSPIILLDEATSALDSESEQQVQQALDELIKGRTVLTIAHRLSTIEQADIIYVVENGVIAEQGKHNELMKQGCIYRNLYHLQHA